MSRFAPAMRLIRLVGRARWRSAGVGPWVALLGWIVYVRVQEPALLRSFGIELTGQAVYAATALLLLPMLTLARPTAWYTAAAANLVLAVSLAIVQATLALGADLFADGSKRTSWAQSCVAFGIAWAPVAITMSRKIDSSRGHANRGWGQLAASAAALAAGITLSVRLWADLRPGNLCWAIACTAAAALWASASRTITHEHR